MKKLFITGIISLFVSHTSISAQNNIYDFTVTDASGESVSMSEYKGKVMLIVNTASHCGFTPQYTEMETIYTTYNHMGFEILDFPCNQFGEQAPEDDKEYVNFCRLNYDTKFRQFHKIDVNGDNEEKLFKWLKQQCGFQGFEKEHKLTPLLESMFDKSNPGWRNTSDIKWNFTKFLVNRQGKVIARFEPTAAFEKIVSAIQKALSE